MAINYISTSDLKKQGWKGKGYYQLGGGKHSKGLWVKTDEQGKPISFISLGSPIKNSNGDYVQLNSDGTVIKLYDSKTGKINKIVNNTDASAMSRGYVYGKEGWHNDVNTSMDEWIDRNYNDIYQRILSDKNYQQQLAYNGLNLQDPNIMDKAVQEYGSHMYKQFSKSASKSAATQKEKAQYQKQSKQQTKPITLGFNDYQARKPQMDAYAQYTDARKHAVEAAENQYRINNPGKPVPDFSKYDDANLSWAAYGQGALTAQLADNLNKGIFAATAGTLAGGVAGKVLVPTALNNLRYMVQHPVESFVVFPQVSNLLEKGTSQLTDNKLVQKAAALFGSGISVPALMQNLRRNVGVPLLTQFEASQAGKQLYNYVKGAPEYLTKAMTNVDLNFNPTVSITEAVSRNPTVQNAAKQLFVNKPLQYLYYYTPGAMATSGIATGLDALNFRTGNGFVDGTIDAAIYATGAKGSNKAKTLISNLKTLSGGSQTFSEGATNILRNVKDHGIFNLFSSTPTSSTKYYTMSYKPSKKQLKVTDNRGVNTGQGGSNSFASYESEGIGIKPLSDYENLTLGKAPGKDGITVISKDYVGHKNSENSSIQEILLNQSYTNFPGDRSRQTKGSRRVIAVSNGESALTIPELKAQGFTQYVNKDKEFKDYDSSEALQDILQFSGRGDFRQGDSGYNYNGAGMRISGIFRNPKTKELKVFMHDPSGVGSVGYQSGSPGVASAMADSDSPSVNVFKTETISSPEELKVFNNRYLQRDPNKAHIPNNLKDKVLSFMGLRHTSLLSGLQQLQEQAEESTIKAIKNKLAPSKEAESEYNEKFSSWIDKLLHPFKNMQITYNLQQKADDLQAALNTRGEQYKEKDSQTESSKKARRAIMTEVVQNSFKKQGGKLKYFI